MPPLPFSSRSNRLAATQLRLTNSEEHQLHRRTQAREFGTGKSKLYGPRTVAIQDAIPCCIRFNGAWPPELCVKKKKNPRGEPGVKVTAMNTCHRNATPSASRLHHLTTRQFALSCRQYLPGFLSAMFVSYERFCIWWAARCVPGSRKSRWFSGLDKWLFTGRRVTVRSLDIRIEGIATTPCNAHAGWQSAGGRATRFSILPRAIVRRCWSASR
jgi:hypothetical protein